MLICAPLEQLDADVVRMQDAMREASRIVLDGFELGTDAKTVRYPDRYMDERGATMWERVLNLINEHQERRAIWPWICTEMRMFPYQNAYTSGILLCLLILIIGLSGTQEPSD